MTKDLLSADTLAARVAARQKFIEEVVNLAGQLLFKQGRRIKQEIHDWYTYEEKELKNFTGFSFYYEGTYSMYGGEMAKVWYHPDLAEGKSEHVVLEVNWQDIAKCEIRHFDESLAWQRALRPIMRNQERIAKIVAAKSKRAQEKKRRASERETALRRARADLEQNAQRLGLRIS